MIKLIGQFVGLFFHACSRGRCFPKRMRVTCGKARVLACLETKGGAPFVS
uniref:Uncharacterized protein n=1 Tax=Anguilla anguilla TaxID=7936 RepID=A0A0E9WJH8_ANGAN